MNSLKGFQSGSQIPDLGDQLTAATGPGSGSTSTVESCRETMKINYEEQAFHHHLTLGLQEKLQKNRLIRNIKTQFRKAIDKQTLSYWERKNGVVLPTDLKEYYQSTDGFKITWSLEYAGDMLHIGELSINPLSQLVEIHQAAKQAVTGGSNSRTVPNARPKTCATDTPLKTGTSSGSFLPGQGPKKTEDLTTPTILFQDFEQTTIGAAGQAKMAMSGLNYIPSNKTFILDSGRCGWGKVCLVYPSPPSSENASTLNSPSTKSGERAQPQKAPASATSTGNTPVEPYVEIWFLDPSYQFHFLAPSFTHFYRMLLFHLGLPQWQYRFTPYGLSSWSEQMFWLVAPHFLQPPKISKFPSVYHGEGLWSTDVPNEAANPNPNVNVLTNQLFRRKKKDKDKN